MLAQKGSKLEGHVIEVHHNKVETYCFVDHQALFPKPLNLHYTTLQIRVHHYLIALLINTTHLFLNLSHEPERTHILLHHGIHLPLSHGSHCLIFF